MKMVKSVFHGTGSESLNWMRNTFVLTLAFCSDEGLTLEMLVLKLFMVAN